MNVLKNIFSLVFRVDLLREKGFDVLFQALPIILHRYPHAHIVFAGEKLLLMKPFLWTTTKELFETYRENVTFLGFLSGGDLAYFYEKLDVFVLSSRIECFAYSDWSTAKKVPIVVTWRCWGTNVCKGIWIWRNCTQRRSGNLSLWQLSLSHQTKNHIKELCKAVAYLGEISWIHRYLDFHFYKSSLWMIIYSEGLLGRLIWNNEL